MIEQTLQQAADLFGAGEDRQAERLCEQVLERAPGHPDALHLLGLLRLRGGRAGEAIAPLRGALGDDPHNLSVLEALSAALAAVGEYGQAEAVIRRMIAAGANLPVISLRLGISLAHQGCWTEALEAFEEAARGDAQFAEAHYQAGNALLELKRAAEAVIALERALALDPRHAEAHNARGAASHALGRTEEAVAAFRRALALNDAYTGAHQNLGRVLLEQGRLEEARSCFERAIRLQGDDAKPYCDMGTVLLGQGKLAGAIEHYEAALALEPGFNGAAYNLALARLYALDFARAWPLFERRLDSEGIRERLRKDPATVDLYKGLARWLGPDEPNVREVALWAEQGIGEQLLFSTLIPDLVEAGVRFTYEVDARLLAAYERAFPGGRFVAWRDPPESALRQADRALFAGSLPGLFRCSRESFARQPARLLAALPDRAAYYRRRLDADAPGLKVALSWRSARRDFLGATKSAPLAAFAPLLALPGVRFVDVQYGDTAAERRAVAAATGTPLLHFDEVDYYHDLEELLAILEACDLLITTSNATAHLAGALGKRTWLLYPGDHPPFHYWAHGGSHRALWYPSVEIVTAPHLADWRSLVERAAENLQSERPRR